MKVEREVEEGKGEGRRRKIPCSLQKSRSTKDPAQDPALEEEEEEEEEDPIVETQPGTSTGGETTTAPSVIVVEGPEEEYEIPEGKKTYSADPENWLAQIPGDHCEYISLYFKEQ